MLEKASAFSLSFLSSDIRKLPASTLESALLFAMENQVIRNRYIKLEDLVQLLKSLFENFEIEVSLPHPIRA